MCNVEGRPWKTDIIREKMYWMQKEKQPLEKGVCVRVYFWEFQRTQQQILILVQICTMRQGILQGEIRRWSHCTSVITRQNIYEKVWLSNIFQSEMK